jgi:hypothetical protein
VGQNYFNNFGTLNVRTHPTGTFEIQAPFENMVTGVINVISGTLRFMLGGTHSGILNHAEGSFVKFGTG